ncbi:MAG: UvrD-helicase domain-containing protein [Myxococcota bacterium]
MADVPSLTHLNDPQREAVLHDGGPLVVFAGAGSGKTRVITHRIAHLIAARGVPPWRIMAVTFTNKAAAEMRERLEQLAPGQGGLQVGTFHSTCARLLRRHAGAAGVRRDFTIYDDADQKAMVKRVTGDLGLDGKRFTPKQVANLIGRAKQEMKGPGDLDIDTAYDEIIARIYERYEERMAACGALDFGDLIYRLVRALEENEGFRDDLSSQIEHLLVDEFQDTNHAQLRLVNALASVHRKLTVVGDDDQSIYRWRGADRRNILDFRRFYPDAKLIKLEQNYRSSKRILRTAHAVIAKNLDREPKEMWTDNDEGEKVFVVRTQDERVEASLVVSGVRELQQKGEELDSIALFYRTHAQSRVLEEALRAANIPYRIVGGLRFYDRAEVKDLLAYLRVLHNPDDDVSLLRIINTPARGLGKTSIGRLLDLAAERGEGVYAALAHAQGDARFGAAAKRRLGEFRELLESLRQDAKRLPLADLPGAVLTDTGYVANLKGENTAEADARIQNLEELAGSIQEFAELQEGDAELADFLEEITLQTDRQDDDETLRLTLMTVHAAKGLEFDTVMVVGLEEGMFPMMGNDFSADEEELAEERRLAYVAFTRARHRLILSFADMRRIFGQLRPGSPSRFLLEVPEEDGHFIGAGGESAAPKPQPRYQADPWDSPAAPSGYVPPRGGGESYIDYGDGDDLGIRKGMRVRHRKFGVGRIEHVDMGATPKATVRFDDWGRKTIALHFLESA